MKGKSLLMVLTLFTSMVISCTKNTIEEPQVNVTQPDPVESPDAMSLTFTKKTAPVLLEFTSTGCSGCGSWGKPTFKKLVNSYEGKVTPLAVHIKYGDPMITEESTAIGANRHGSFYTPQIWVMDENAVLLNGGSISAASEQNARELIDASLTTDQPALAATIKKENNKMEVMYGVKFIDMDPEGEYSLACYLTEDGIKHQQSSSAMNPATHDHVLRASAGGAFGIAFTGADLRDNEKAWSQNFDISAYESGNVYVTVILWKKSGSRYMPVNGYTAR